MLDVVAAPQKEELGNRDCSDRQDFHGGDHRWLPPMVNEKFARLAKEEMERNHNNCHKCTFDNANHHCRHCNGNNNNDNEHKGPLPFMPINSSVADVATICVHVNRMYSEGGRTPSW